MYPLHMKPCKACGEVKRFDQFYKHKETKDGFRSCHQNEHHAEARLSRDVELSELG